MDEPTSPTKRCIKCGETKPLSEFPADRSFADGYRSACKLCRRDQRSGQHPEGRRRRRKAQKRHQRETNPEQWRTARARQARQQQAAHRKAVFDHYGWACTCCGRTSNLTIDHVDGTGRAHRLELFRYTKKTGRIYAWLAREGFPDGFATLCRPCNSSKRDGDRCRLDHTKALSTNSAEGQEQ